MRFTLKQLSYFVAAGEASSITLASERVRISQPSISSAISQLEAEFGVQLFFRHHAQGLSLTPAGQRFLVAARDLLRQADTLQDLADEVTSTIGGPLRIGAFRTFAPLILPELCVGFAEAHPKVTLQMFEDDEAGLIAKVRNAELDIALTYEQKGVDLNFEQLALLPTYVLLPARHGLAKSGSLSLKDLAGQPFVLLDLPVSRDYFESLFRKAGLPLNIVARSEQAETVRSYVASGFGFSLLTARPKSTTALNGGELAYLYLDDDFPPMKLGMVTAKTIRKTRAVEAFGEHCRRSITTHAIPGMLNL
ncbi:DNA-binding transcriptional LysR family regulator [Novosphingobium chloroacetimidivorans]|uniref:DNA-binding transcriptional LysR family regulator n=1 Tax=Novosphingobium chloroacetimidivorans TaxID=1428314 RepID=A0A7W7NXS3_9SPHN|nr:LysR family transcriptional regulator [Novosphingobium chloroacetimidivorans]MBB4860661.1 DNA-binding transcriptional LysR family regulator [Novosphingobium chloroacetimidivorans]